jgi:hypothetical protein
MLENVKKKGNNIIARCPACAENGKDRKGEHLFIDAGGRYGCVVFPGSAGREHRRRIFQLVGKKDYQRAVFKIKSPAKLKDTVIEKNILGRLGRANKSYARIANKELPDTIKEDVQEPVPSVPKKSGFFIEEEKLLKSIDAETQNIVLMAKRIFNGLVVSVT